MCSEKYMPSSVRKQARKEGWLRITIAGELEKGDDGECAQAGRRSSRKRATSTRSRIPGARNANDID